jgi:hypothetical protein
MLIPSEAADAVHDAASFKLPDEESISRILARFQHIEAVKGTKE